jgi:cobalt transporter subunit CbtB
MSHPAATVAAGRVGHRTSALAALVVAIFGLALIYGIGLAQPQAIHNAAHDARHAFAFPCH